MRDPNETENEPLMGLGYENGVVFGEEDDGEDYEQEGRNAQSQ